MSKKRECQMCQKTDDSVKYFDASRMRLCSFCAQKPNPVVYVADLNKAAIQAEVETTNEVINQAYEERKLELDIVKQAYALEELKTRDMGPLLRLVRQHRKLRGGQG